MKAGRRAWLAWMATAPLGAGGVVLPRPAAAAEPEAAPPARIGQLSFAAGPAQMRLDEEQGWEPAELNTPVSTGTALATDPGARIEVRIGSAALRLGPLTRCTVTTLDDTMLAVSMPQGRLSLRVRALAPGEQVELVAGRARLQVLTPGAYRMTHGDQPSRLTVHVLEGQARLVTGAQETLLDAGRLAVADTQAGALLSPPRASDERVPLDDFADKRDRRSELSAALARLPAEMTGAEALDGHGVWRNEAGYGPVWYPLRVSAEWAPYRYGRWRWMAPWGWTWIDEAPWGFAPFHYGRWLFQGGRWGWVPGRTAAVALGTRPVYAPALVGFYGDAASAEWTPVAGEPAVVGWYPLAPGEVYWPAYSGHVAYARALNAAHVADAGSLRAWPDPQAGGPAHRYARTAFAATAMPLAAFQAMQPVAGQQVALPPAALARAPVAARRAPPARPRLVRRMLERMLR